MRPILTAVLIPGEAEPGKTFARANKPAAYARHAPRPLYVFPSFACSSSFFPVPRMLYVAAIVLSVIVVVPRTVYGDGPETAPLVRYVPASAKLCVTVRRLEEVDAAMKRAHAWRLLPALVGVSGEDDRPFELRRAVTELFRFTGGRDTNELMRSEVGLVAPSWDRFDNAVWLVRVSDDEVLDRWFPPTRRLGGGAFGAVRLFRTRDGFTVCVREGIAAIGRQWGSGSLLDQTMKLMVEPGGDALEESRSYRELAAYLPPNPLAQIYMARRLDADDAGLVHRLWWPKIERAVVGVYEGEGRLDIGVRAALAEPHTKTKLAQSAIQQLLRLPLTTLYASATTVDFEAAVDATASGADRGALADYIAFIAIVQHLVGGPTEEWPKLGPHLLTAWDQDLREKGTTPQAAVLIECQDGQAVSDHMRRMVAKLLGFLRTLDSEEAGNALRITDQRHLGVVISSVRLDTYAHRSTHALAKLFENVEPAWAVWNGWLIVALSRDHLERILDAQFGLAPTLATVSDVRALGQGAQDRTVVSIVQPGLATRVLGRWLSAHRQGEPSLLDPKWWQPEDTSNRQLLPGVTFTDAEEAGSVVIGEVDQDSAMAEALQAGDRVVGINGRLLSLSGPMETLEEFMSGESENGPLTLRVLRNQTMLEVEIPAEAAPAPVASMRIDPAEAIAELISLGRTLQSASFAVNMSEARQYSARLSLRFARPGKVNARQPQPKPEN